MHSRCMKISAIILSLCVAVCFIIPREIEAGAIAELFGIEDDTGGFVTDNTYDYVAIGKLSDFGESTGQYFTAVGTGSNITKYRPERAAQLVSQGNRLVYLSNGLRAGGQVLNLYNTSVDTYKLFTETSKHETSIERGVDKTLLVVDVGMGWYAVGAGVVALVTAPAWGTGVAAAAAATGTVYLVTKIGVGVTRVAFNSETYRNISRNVRGFMSGEKKIVFAPFHRPGMKEGLDIIEEELGFDLYPGLRREIPDPSTGIPVYKPNIYLYSDADMTVNVRLYPAHWITESAPAYPADSGWTVHITDGSLNGTEDYLFYEAVVPDEGFQKDYGYKVYSKDREQDIERVLDLYGFNEKEKQDFLDYWTDKLEEDVDYIFLPQENNEVDIIMPLIISEAPDKIYRIWFYILPDDGSDIKEPSDISVISRDGFTVVEWGGILP
jgi:hypothetical protein